MNALNYLNNVITNKSAFVPEHLAPSIVEAARHLGVTLCGGMYDDESQMRMLYVA